MGKCSGCNRDMRLYYHWKDDKVQIEGNFCSKGCAIGWAAKAYLKEIVPALQ